MGRNPQPSDGKKSTAFRWEEIHSLQMGRIPQPSDGKNSTAFRREEFHSLQTAEKPRIVQYLLSDT